jgi:hypothetical protein
MQIKARERARKQKSTGYEFKKTIKNTSKHKVENPQRGGRTGLPISFLLIATLSLEEEGYHCEQTPRYIRSAGRNSLVLKRE